MKRFSIYVLLLSLFWGSNYASADSIAVIVNRARAVDRLSITQLARMYKGQRQEWSDGRQIIAVNRPVDSEIRRVFYQKVLGSKPAQKFHTPGSPIQFRTMIQRSSLATMRFVNNLPEAIGYLYLSELELDEESKNIKVILVIEIEDNHNPPSKPETPDRGE